jgi:GTPase SAR1 family protein
MQKIIKAQQYLECSARIQYHMKEVFEEAIKIVLHPPIAEVKNIETIHKWNCCEIA